MTYKAARDGTPVTDLSAYLPPHFLHLWMIQKAPVIYSNPCCRHTLERDALQCLFSDASMPERQSVQWYLRSPLPTSLGLEILRELCSHELRHLSSSRWRVTVKAGSIAWR
jgi:hypothetical protein